MRSDKVEIVCDVCRKSFIVVPTRAHDYHLKLPVRIENGWSEPRMLDLCDECIERATVLRTIPITEEWFGRSGGPVTKKVGERYGFYDEEVDGD